MAGEEEVEEQVSASPKLAKEESGRRTPQCFETSAA